MQVINYVIYYLLPKLTSLTDKLFTCINKYKAILFSICKQGEGTPMSSTTTQGKKAALRALAERREQNRDRPPVDTASLSPGSDLHFNCLKCWSDIVVPEGRVIRPELCLECLALRRHGWLD